MLTKETVPLTGDGRWNSFCSPAAPCMSINAFVFRFCLHTPLLAQNPCNPSGSLLDLPRPIGNATAHAHAHAHWHPCSCQSMCRVTVSLHLSVTCMSVCLFYVTPGERISNSSRLPTCELAGCQLGFLLSCLLSCFPAYLLAILAGRGQGARSLGEGCSASDGWIFGFGTCTWITSLILMRACLSRFQCNVEG